MGRARNREEARKATHSTFILLSMARQHDRYSFWAAIDPAFQKLADTFHDLNAQLEAVKLPLLLGRSSF